MSKMGKLHDDAHAALHRCWSAAVGTDKYNKNDWKLIERQIHAYCSGGCLVDTSAYTK